MPPEFTDNQSLPALENSSTSRVSSNLNVTPHHVQTNGGMSRSLSAFPEFVVITLIGIAIACCSIPLLMCISPFVRRGARRSSTTSSDELVGKGGNQSMISMYSSMFASRFALDFPSNGSWRSDSSTASTIDIGSHKSEHSTHDIGQGYGDRGRGLGIEGSQ